MNELTAALRLLISGDSAGAVAAIKAVSDEEVAAGAKTKEANAAQMSGMKAVKSAAMASATGLGIVVGAIALATNSYAKWGEQVIRGAALTGMSTEQYSKFAGETKAYGISVDTLTGSMKFYEKQTWAAEKGTKASVDAFAALGISQQQLKTMSPAASLALTRDRLSQVSNSAEKTALMTQLFGRGSAAMTLWVNASSDSIRKLDEYLKAHNLLLDHQSAETLKKGAEAVHDLGFAWQQLEFKIAQSVLPGLITLGRYGLMPLMDLATALAPVLKWLVLPLGALTVAFGGVLAVQKVLTMAQTTWLALQTLVKVALVADAYLHKEVSFAEAKELLSTNALKAATVADTVAVEENTVATEEQRVKSLAMGGAVSSGTSLIKMQILELGLWGIALAGAAIAIYELVKAYQGWKDAADQAATAAANAQSAVDNLTPAQRAGFDRLAAAGHGESAAGISSDVQRDKYSWGGVSGSIQSVLAGNHQLYGNSSPTGIVGGIASKAFASGGHFETHGEQQITVGDNPGGREEVHITPLGSDGRGGSSKHVIQLVMQSPVFNGAPDRATAERWAGALLEPLGNKLYDAMEGAT